jgi:ATP:ADP antiporter, AAA family
MPWNFQTIRHVSTIRKNDYINSVLLFLYLFLVITSLMIAKSVSTALFITEFGALQLPYGILGQTILITILIALYLRLAHVIRQSLLIPLTLLFLAANAVLLWWLLLIKQAGVITVLYMWGGMFGVIAPVQVWTIGNYIFTTREARRYFSFIGSGGILGFIFGGYLSKALAPVMGTENLLSCVAGFCCVAAALASYLWRRNREKIADLQADAAETSEPISLKQSAKYIVESKYLLLITALVTIASLATKIVDVQFSAITEQFVRDKDEMTAFFGGVYTWLGWAAFFLQIFLGGRILDRLGIGITILILPLSLLISSLAALFFTALWTAVLLRLSDQVFKHSIDKSTTELLYLPIPTEIKFPVKSFIDTVVLRAGDGVAGLLLLFFTHIIPLINPARPGWISLLNLPIIGLLIWVALQIRHEYLNALRSGFQNRELDPEKIAQFIAEPATLQELRKYLESQQEEETLYALDIMTQGEWPESLLLPHLRRLLPHPSAFVRLKVVQLLSTFSRASVVPEVESLLTDPDIEIRTEAARYVYTYCQADLLTRIKSLPDYPDHVIQGGVLLNLLTQDRPDNLPVARIFLDRMVEDKDESGKASRIEAARVLGLIPLPEKWHCHLIDLLQDESPDVISQALDSAGKSQHHEFIPFLLEALQNRHTKVAAREALVHYGPRIFGTLKDHLNDPTVRTGIRREIPRVLTRIGGQEAVQILLDCLEQDNLKVRYRILKALNRLRAADAQLHFEDRNVLNQLFAELRYYYHSAQLLEAFNPSASEDGSRRQQDLLTISLLERQERTMERIFRLMSLLYPHQDIYHAYYGLRSSRPQSHANAVEFLDNLLDPELRKFLLPLIDSKETLQQRVRKGREFWNWNSISRAEALAELINADNRWLSACAMYMAGQLQLAELTPYIWQRLESPDPLLRETANLVSRWDFRVREEELGFGMS